jgi:hypothetical protein
MTEPRRDRWGRYIIPDPETGEDREWTRATTLASVLPDRFHLERWGERMVVLGLAKADDLYLLAQTAKYEDKQRLDKIARDAKDRASAGSRANIGTALHSFTEMVDAGKSIDVVPTMYRRDVVAYQDALRQLNAKVLAMETIVVNPIVGIAGTFDRVLETNYRDKPVIVDIKTGNTVHFGFLEYSVQLSAYANSSHVFDIDTGEVKPIPWDLDKDVGLILHMPAGTGRCEVWELDLARGWHAAKVAVQVREMRSWKDLGKKLQAVEEEK